MCHPLSGPKFLKKNWRLQKSNLLVICCLEFAFFVSFVCPPPFGPCFCVGCWNCSLWFAPGAPDYHFLWVLLRQGARSDKSLTSTKHWQKWYETHISDGSYGCGCGFCCGFGATVFGVFVSPNMAPSQPSVSRQSAASQPYSQPLSQPLTDFIAFCNTSSEGSEAITIGFGFLFFKREIVVLKSRRPTNNIHCHNFFRDL